MVIHAEIDALVTFWPPFDHLLDTLLGTFCHHLGTLGTFGPPSTSAPLLAQCLQRVVTRDLGPTVRAPIRGPIFDKKNNNRQRDPY